MLVAVSPSVPAGGRSEEDMSPDPGATRWRAVLSRAHTVFTGRPGPACMTTAPPYVQVFEDTTISDPTGTPQIPAVGTPTIGPWEMPGRRQPGTPSTTGWVTGMIPRFTTTMELTLFTTEGTFTSTIKMSAPNNNITKLRPMSRMPVPRIRLRISNNGCHWVFSPHHRAIRPTPTWFFS